MICKGAKKPPSWVQAVPPQPSDLVPRKAWSHGRGWGGDLGSCPRGHHGSLDLGAQTPCGADLTHTDRVGSEKCLGAAWR